MDWRILNGPGKAQNQANILKALGEGREKRAAMEIQKGSWKQEDKTELQGSCWRDKSQGNLVNSKTG